MNRSSNQHIILFNNSTIDACFDYLKNPTNNNLQHVTFTPGAQLAYKHHLWSSTERLTIKNFWKKTLKPITWSEQLENSVTNVIEHLNKQPQNKWLQLVLDYLPEGHTFNTTVYLIIGYDNIVYDENVALNLNFNKFHLDPREAVYYLIHELAHAGYLRYHKMPNLMKPNTASHLTDTVKLLTHLEGMGVISPFKLRLKENGLLDNDYHTLLNETENNKRVTEYFNLLSKLENQTTQKLHTPNLKILDQMSRKPKRLWYITDCHMAQTIEKTCGTKTLKNLVKQGPEQFFKEYNNIEQH